MIFNPSEYNPFPNIIIGAKRMGSRVAYNEAFYDFVRRELFQGGVVPETEEEWTEILVLLLDMDII